MSDLLSVTSSQERIQSVGISDDDSEYIDYVCSICIKPFKKLKKDLIPWCQVCKVEELKCINQSIIEYEIYLQSKTSGKAGENVGGQKVDDASNKVDDDAGGGQKVNNESNKVDDDVDAGQIVNDLSNKVDADGGQKVNDDVGGGQKVDDESSKVDDDVDAGQIVNDVSNKAYDADGGQIVNDDVGGGSQIVNDASNKVGEDTNDQDLERARALLSKAQSAIRLADNSVLTANQYESAWRRQDREAALQRRFEEQDRKTNEELAATAARFEEVTTCLSSLMQP